MTSLVDSSDVAEQLHKTPKAEELSALDQYVETASNIVIGMCLPLLPETVTDLLDGGQSTVMLSRYPVNAVTSVTTYDTTGSAVVVEAGGTTGLYDGWSLDYQSGALRRVGQYVWPSGIGNVEVVYTVGPDSVPAEVFRAVVLLVEDLWQSREFRRQQGGPNQDAMGWSPSYAVSNQVIELLRGWLKPPRVA